MDIVLNSAKIENFKSLGNVTLQFRDLTIIVGANSSGKSNSLEVLQFLNYLVKKVGTLGLNGVENMGVMRLDTPEQEIKILTNFLIYLEDDDDIVEANYSINLTQKNNEFVLSKENLDIHKQGKIIKIINMENNKGIILNDENSDEDRNNYISYHSKNSDLVLNIAGNLGDKPLTSYIAEFVREWKFYDIDPEYIKIANLFGDQLEKLRIKIESSMEKKVSQKNILVLDARGSKLQEILVLWAEQEPERFASVNHEIYNCLGINLELDKDNEKPEIKIIEKNDTTKKSLLNMSDGTLRLITYCILLCSSELPPLIAIEEPERNLHPAILTNLAYIIRRLSQETQVIITTHSSQLLDCFSLEEIQDDVSVLLLTKTDSSGTQVYPLDELSNQRDSLSGWMQDFGVGSAVYHSNLLQDFIECHHV